MDGEAKGITVNQGYESTWCGEKGSDPAVFYVKFHCYVNYIILYYINRREIAKCYPYKTTQQWGRTSSHLEFSLGSGTDQLLEGGLCCYWPDGSGVVLMIVDFGVRENRIWMLLMLGNLLHPVSLNFQITKMGFLMAVLWMCC